MPEEVRLVIYGTPVPKGSMVAMISRSTGKAMMIPSNRKELAPWEKSIKRAATEIMGAELPWTGPVRAFLTFTLYRPAAAEHREYPTETPDIDKLTRAVFDALKGTVFDDDKRVVDQQSRKRYVGHDEALAAPGLRATFVQLTPPQAQQVFDHAAAIALAEKAREAVERAAEDA